MTYTTMVSTARDHGSPLNEDIATGFYDRDEELRERPIYLEMAEVGPETSTSYVQQKAWQLYVPQWCSQLIVAFQMHHTNAVSVEAQCKIGALTSDAPTTTNSTYGSNIFECTFSDLSSVLSTEVTLTFWLQRTGSSGASPRAYAREADGPASYFFV